MAIQHARVCGACERECPSWAHRCPSCGSTAVSYQLIIAPAEQSRVGKVTGAAARVRRSRARVATVADPGVHLRTTA